MLGGAYKNGDSPARNIHHGNIELQEHGESPGGPGDGTMWHDRGTYMIIWSSMAPYGHICAHMANMAHVGTICVHMASHGPIWTHMAEMAHVAQCWADPHGFQMCPPPIRLHMAHMAAKQ